MWNGNKRGFKVRRSPICTAVQISRSTMERHAAYDACGEKVEAISQAATSECRLRCLAHDQKSIAWVLLSQWLGCSVPFWSMRICLTQVVCSRRCGRFDALAARSLRVSPHSLIFSCWATRNQGDKERWRHPCMDSMAYGVVVLLLPSIDRSMK